METLVIRPANSEEADLLKNLAKRMKLKYSVLDDDDQEDFGLAKAMLAVKGSKVVSKESVMKKLRS